MALGKGLGSILQTSKKEQVRTQGPVPGLAELDTPSQGGVLYVSIAEVSPNATQPRKHFATKPLEDLGRSIQKHGIVQPLIVVRDKEQGYELIAGERRLRAAKLAGLTMVPVVVRKAGEQEKLELALIENIQRQDLSPIEEANSYNRLIDEFSLTQQLVADQLGKSRPLIANTVRLLQLPAKIQQALTEGVISVGKARALLGIASEKEQLALFDAMVGAQMNTRDVEEAANEQKKQSGKGSVRKDPNIVAQEQVLEERFGSRVRIIQRGKKGSITISFHSNDELRRLLEELA